MSDISTLAKFQLNDMIAEYLIDRPSQAVSLRIYPAALESQVAVHRERLKERKIPVWLLEPLVQFKLLGDATDEYTQGVTMRNSASVAGLHLEDQQVITEGDQT